MPTPKEVAEYQSNKRRRKFRSKLRALASASASAGGGSRGTELPLGGLDHFSKDAATYAIYGATQPSAFYDSVGDKTWLSNEAWNGTGREIRSNTYDHAIGAFAGPYTVLANPLVDDDHGVPSAVIHPNGHVFKFGCAHGVSAILCASTANPRDPTTWVQQASLGNGTYPHCFVVGNEIYVFFRGGSAEWKLFMQKATPVGGTISSWSAAVEVGTMEGSARWYQGTGAVVGTDIHMTASKAATGSDLVRQNVYYVIFDTLTQGIKNYDGSSVIASGSLPVNLATLQASYRLVDQETGGTSGNIVSLLRQGTNSYIAYMDGTAGGTDYKLKCITNIGVGWTAPEEIGAFATNHANHRYDGYCVAPTAVVGVVEFYWMAEFASFIRGGKLVKRPRAIDATLGAQTDVRLPDRGYAYDNPVVIYNGRADAIVMFSETHQPPAEERQLRSYIIGYDGSPLKRAIPAPSAGININFQNASYNGTTFWSERDKDTSTGSSFAINADGSLVVLGLNGMRRGTKGLMVAPTKISLLGSSRNIGGSGWANTGVTQTANSALSRDGTMSGDKLTKDSSAARRSSYTIVGVANSLYTGVFDIKADSISTATIRFVNNTPSQVTAKLFTLTGAGAISNISTPELTGFVDAFIEQLSDLWYRCWLVVQMPATGTNHQLWVSPGDVLLAQNGASCFFDLGGWQVGNTIADNLPPIATAAAASGTEYQDENYFGIPAVVNTLTYTFFDDTTQIVDVTAANKGAYMIPVNLNRRGIKTIVGSA